MNLLHRLVVRLLIWDCDYAIQRLNASIKRQQEELREREARKHALQVALFWEEHA